MENEKFFNYYVELLTSSLHDAIGKNLVFQTQAKIAKEDLDSKNQTIENLSEKLEEYINYEENAEKTVQEKSAELNHKLVEINNLIQERDAAKNEAKHIETFRNELINVKQQLQNKDSEVNRIKLEYEKLISEIKREQEEKNKELEEKVYYLQLTPAQKRKYDNQKIKTSEINDDLNKDGGSF